VPERALPNTMTGAVLRDCGFVLGSKIPSIKNRAHREKIGGAE
jgi:hypothetical protein